jgi:hypothetical protein
MIDSHVPYIADFPCDFDFFAKKKIRTLRRFVMLLSSVF